MIWGWVRFIFSKVLMDLFFHIDHVEFFGLDGCRGGAKSSFLSVWCFFRSFQKTKVVWYCLVWGFCLFCKNVEADEMKVDYNSEFDEKSVSYVTLGFQTPWVWRYLDPKKNIPKTPNPRRYDWKPRVSQLFMSSFSWSCKSSFVIIGSGSDPGGRRYRGEGNLTEEDWKGSFLISPHKGRYIGLWECFCLGGRKYDDLQFPEFEHQVSWSNLATSNLHKMIHHHHHHHHHHPFFSMPFTLYTTPLSPPFRHLLVHGFPPPQGRHLL